MSRVLTWFCGLSTGVFLLALIGFKDGTGKEATPSMLISLLLVAAGAHVLAYIARERGGAA